MADPNLNSATLAESYGFAAAFLNSNPELKKLFALAVKQTWTSDMFTAKLRGTTWWKTHDQNERNYLVSVASDPATARQNMQQALTTIRQQAAQMGLDINNAAIAAKLQGLAYNQLAKGESNNQIQYELGSYLNVDPNHLLGDAGTQFDQLHQYAYSMGVNQGTSWYQDAVRKIEQGTGTLEDYKSQINKAAKAAYPQFSTQIDGGQTIKDLASPYLSSMAQILEINPGTINLTDPTIKNALGYKDPTTGKVGSQPLWSFEQTLRNDPRWGKTQNAQDSAMQTAHKVLVDFGMGY